MLFHLLVRSGEFARAPLPRYSEYIVVEQFSHGELDLAQYAAAGRA
jgi:hypothetical protein